MNQLLTVQTSGSGPDLVLLHGWGMHSAVWQAVLPVFEKFYTVHAIDLPGHGVNAGVNAGENFQDWVSVISAAAPDNSIWLGWSLGGLLAVAAAQKAPKKIRALVLVASTPKFISADDWLYAMPPELLDGFISALDRDTGATLQKFIGLQMLGETRLMQGVRLLKTLLAQHEATTAALRAGLVFLRDVDLRDAFKTLNCPVLAVFGDEDKVVPASVGDGLRALNPAVYVETIAGSGHLPFLFHADTFGECVIDWLQGRER